MNRPIPSWLVLSVVVAVAAVVVLVVLGFLRFVAPEKALINGDPIQPTELIGQGQLREVTIAVRGGGFGSAPFNFYLLEFSDGSCVTVSSAVCNTWKKGQEFRIYVHNRRAFLIPAASKATRYNDPGVILVDG